MRLPPLNQIRVFHALGRSASIRSAAVELGVSHTAVARQIKELEAWFGVKLVETTAAGTVLNADGRRLHAHVHEAFELIERGTAEIRPPGQSRELRIWSAAGIATYWLVPRLHLLQSVLPRIAISLLPTEQSPSFEKGEVDVEVCYGERDGENLVSIDVVRPRAVVLASHKWIEANKEVTKPEHLARHKLLHERRRDDWNDWFAALGIDPGPLDGPRLGVLPAVVEALHRDLGAGLVPEPFVDEHLARGNLRQVIPEMPRLKSYSVVFHQSRTHDEAIQGFAKWLKDSFNGY